MQIATRMVFEVTIADDCQQEYFVTFLNRFRATLRENQVAKVELSVETLPPPPPKDDLK